MEEGRRTNGIWVFGYGSLVWNPGFDFGDAQVGFVRGYVRRFWQANEVHRGTPKEPGRVATIVEDKEGITWGRAFQLLETNANTAISYLNTREGKLGGYSSRFVQFQPRDSREDPFPVLLYVAMPSNPLFTGPTPLNKVADVICRSKGQSGHNVDYLMRLATFMREHVPGVWDDHLFGLEKLVQERMQKETTDRRPEEQGLAFGGVRRNVEMDTAEDGAATSTGFSSSIPSRKLRCVDM